MLVQNSHPQVWNPLPTGLEVPVVSWKPEIVRVPGEC